MLTEQKNSGIKDHEANTGSSLSTNSGTSGPSKTPESSETATDNNPTSSGSTDMATAKSSSLLTKDNVWLCTKIFFSVAGASLNGLSAYQSEESGNRPLAWYFFAGSFLVNIAVNFIFCDDTINGILSNKPLSTKLTAAFFTALYVTAAIELSHRVYSLLSSTFGFPAPLAIAILAISTAYAGFSRMSTNLNGQERIKQYAKTFKLANLSLTDKQLTQRRAIYELIRDLERMKFQIPQASWDEINKSMNQFTEHDPITKDEVARKLTSLVIAELEKCQNFEGAWWRTLIQLGYGGLALGQLLVYKYLSDGFLDRYKILGGWEEPISFLFALPSLCFVLSTVAEAADFPINMFYMRRNHYMADAPNQPTPIWVTLKILAEMGVAIALIIPSSRSLAGPSVDMYNSLEDSSNQFNQALYLTASWDGVLPKEFAGETCAGTPNAKSWATATFTTTVSTHSQKTNFLNALINAFYAFDHTTKGSPEINNPLLHNRVEEVEADNSGSRPKSIAEQAEDYVANKPKTNSTTDYSFAGQISHFRDKVQDCLTHYSGCSPTSS